MSGVLGAAASAGGGIISSLVGGILGQRSQRQQNLQQTLWNNQQLNFQKSMYEDQKRYNMEMWEKQNEYNSPLNQRKRLEAAGFNPLLMMDGSTGVAQSANGVSPMAGSQPGSAAHFDPSSLANTAGTSIVSALGTLMDNDAQEEVRAAQAENLRAEAEIKRIDAFTRAAENTERLKGMKSDRWNKDMNSLNTEKDYELKRVAFNDLVGMKHEELLTERQRRINEEAMNIGIALDNASKRIGLHWQNSLSAAALTRDIAQAKAFSAGANLSYEQAKHTIELRLKTTAEKQGIKLNNEQIEKLMPIVIDKAGYERDRASMNVGPDNPYQLANGISVRLRRDLNSFAEGFQDMLEQGKKGLKNHIRFMRHGVYIK